MPKLKSSPKQQSLVSAPCAQSFLPCRLLGQSCWAGSKIHMPMPQPPWYHFAPKPTWKFVYLSNTRFKTRPTLSKSAREFQKWKRFSSLCNLTSLHDVCMIPAQICFPAPVTHLGFSLSTAWPCSPKLEPWFVASLPLQKGEEGPGSDICADLRCVANTGATRSQ